MAAESAEPEAGAAGRRRAVARRKAKEAAVGAAARVLFNPTLLYNVVRSKVQAESRWWDEVDQFILLGAVPFCGDVPCLQKLGKCILWEYDIYPLQSWKGRSTSIVLCYLVKYKNMTPATAFEHVRSKRARVLLTHSQWRVVQEFSKRNVGLPSVTSHPAAASPAGDAVPVTEADLEGSGVTEVITEDASLSSHKTTPSRPMIKMLSCLFPSLKGSGDPSLTGHRVSEVDAC